MTSQTSRSFEIYLAEVFLDRTGRRDSASGCIEVTLGVAPERKPTNCRIVNAGGETKQG